MGQFRFGVQVSSLTNDSRSLISIARQAEELGYSSLFLPDHLGGDQWSPLAALGAIAVSTESIHIGGLVFCNDYRSPVLLAQEVSTIHELSGGRVEFGLGAGWMKSDYEQIGMSFDRPGVRIERLEEALTIISQLFLRQRVSFSGKHYQIRDAMLPASALAHQPKLIVGGGGKKMLELAARSADIVGINVNLSSGVVGPELVAEVGREAFLKRVDWVRQSAPSKFEKLELQCLTFVAKVSSDANDWLAAMAPAFGMTGDQAKEVPIVLAGDVEEVCDVIEQRRNEFGFSYWVVHQNELEEFAPIVARLSGK